MTGRLVQQQGRGGDIRAPSCVTSEKVGCPRQLTQGFEIACLDRDTRGKKQYLKVSP
jgi:hypothetical protein